MVVRHAHSYRRDTKAEKAGVDRHQIGCQVGVGEEVGSVALAELGVLAKVPGKTSECGTRNRLSPRIAARAKSANPTRLVVSIVPPLARTVPSGTYEVCMPSSNNTASIIAKWRRSRRIARTAPCPAE